jgi:NhaP-type Na+/H+ and K+/H+ antiporter
MFNGFVVNGSATVEAVAAFYGLIISPVDRAKVIADYLRERLYGYPLAGDRVPLGAIELVVLKKSASAVELAGLDLYQPSSRSQVRYRGLTGRKSRH